MARLHSTSVEHLQGTHQVSVEAEKERVTTYEGIKDLQYLPRSIVLGHVTTSRPRDDDTVNRVWLRVKLNGCKVRYEERSHSTRWEVWHCG